MAVAFIPFSITVKLVLDKKESDKRATVAFSRMVRMMNVFAE